MLTNHSYATYIAQHIDHLAACQAKIEAALKRKLRPAPKPTHKTKARGQLKAVA